MENNLIQGQVEQAFTLGHEAAFPCESAQGDSCAVLAAKSQTIHQAVDAPVNGAQGNTQGQRYSELHHQAGIVAQCGTLDQTLKEGKETQHETRGCRVYER